HPPTSWLYSLSLHDALPISSRFRSRACTHRSPTGDRSIRTFRRKKMSLLVKRNISPRRSGNGWARTLSALLLLTTHGKNMFAQRSEEHTSELQSLRHLVCRL